MKPLTPDLNKREKQKHLQTLLNLAIPKLFDIPDKKCLQPFEVGWKKFIESRQMQVTSLECINTFLVSVFCMAFGLPVSSTVLSASHS